MSNIVGNVFCETNYKVFKKLNGNRSINMKIVNRIIESIKKVGQIPVPIVVNENMEVIDGQNRLEAFEILGLPVYYVITNGAGTSECIMLNINQTPWKLGDYIDTYA